MFRKKNRSKKFRKFYRKTPVLESLFNKVAGLESEICEIFKNIYFEDHLRTTASGMFYRQILTVRNFSFNFNFAQFH